MTFLPFSLTKLLLCTVLSSTVASFSRPLIHRRALNPALSGRRNQILTRRATNDEVTTADIEEITTFATNNGVTLSFSSFGPGYRGVALSKDNPENILGYIEGFIRPTGGILHADKMEIFKGALNTARNDSSFSGGGTFLGPGLLIAYVC